MHTRATVCATLSLPVLLLIGSFTSALEEETVSVRIATFNVSMEAGNYLPRDAVPSGRELAERLADGAHPQIRGIAEILQRVRPDIVLLNEFDYFEQPEAAVLPFLRRYLARGQNGQQPLEYPYFYTAPVNTGVPSGHDLNRDGRSDGSGQDAFGYGLYPGQYGMLILSRYPLLTEAARTFRHFLWRDMPDNLMQSMQTPEGEPWYDADVQDIFRLSSKSHWDVAVDIGGRRLHLLASHPTPPGFDGPEDRNGRRNHDEIRFWVDYISGGEQAAYIVDDAGGRGGLRGERFVILGDLNASPVEGDARQGAIRSLVAHSKVNDDAPPTSAAGAAASPGNRHAGSHTASWGLRADYVLPSRAGGSVTDSGVYWPGPGEPGRTLVESRAASSDHRLVWVDLVLEPLPE
ncbi:endonuclease/exonuclease/phosphatase family protein [Chromatocurvus halotolerans]|uniref:Endonuclease/exonuclease/phosphatase family protein n=1 Tax=Chromatocurvus halotolerans TaxID=1132028 RepID=A0A4R2KFB8_9GAMM|nr:endonuclease/exonuclease/phosphatase family protein [Chromatocurvus halotolerans]TCO71754.1 endonuclease/exonuclease/phosphatase family protein [Chromatocurvus halotolerans]